MAFSYNKKNLANTTITGAITPTQTSVTVADATVFSYAFFYATLMPSNEMSNASNSEIVLVTNIQGNTLTLVRGQENTIARSFPYGAVITNGIYTRDIDYARSIGRKVFMARDDGTDDTNTSYQIIDPMIKNVPEEGSIITVEFGTPSYGAPTLGVNNGIGGLVQVSGTDIHITDSSGQIDSVEMYGDTEQTTYSGKNKYNATKASSTSNTVTTSADTGQLYVNGATSTDFGIEFGYTSLPAGTYTFCLELVSGSITSTSTGGLFNFRGDNITLVSCPISNSTKKNSVQVTVSANTTNARIQLWCRTTETFTNAVVKYQLVSGSSADYNFEPYVGGVASPNPDYPQEVQTVTGRQVVTISDGGSESQEYEINLGKNLCDGVNQEYWLTSAATGAGVSSGNSGLIIPIEQNTRYTISTTSSQSRYRIAFSDQTYQGSQINCYNGANRDGTSDVITRNSENHKYLIVNATDLTKIQIEKGSSASSFAPYFTPIELCKIGDYQDYIYKSGEDWYIHKELGEFNLADYKDLTGWYVTGGGEHCVKHMWSNNFPITDIKPQPNMTSLGYGLSNYFTECNYADLYNGIQKVGFAFGLDGIYLSNNGWTLEGFRTWITGKVVNMYYIKTTPTDIQITNATLIAQLNALYNMLPEGVADVVVTGDLAGSLTIKYYQQGTGTHTAPIVGGAEIDGGDNEQVVELDSYLPYRLVYDTNGYWRVLNKGPKVTTGAIADGAVTPEKLSVNPGKYNTAETVIGKWIDGKPIYRMVFQYTLSGSSWNTVGTITGIGEVTRIYGAYKRPNGIQTEFPRNTMDTYIETDGTIHVMDTEGNGGTVKCIVEYTKSN